MSDFGVITLAAKHDYVKAVGLLFSVKQNNPDVPVSIVCSQIIADKVGRYFDSVIIEDSNLRGFEHKLYLDKYSPYERTFFFDADILVFDDLLKLYELWQGSSYIARGTYITEGFSSFGLDRKLVLDKIGKEKLVVIGGAGHAYFEKPACGELFTLARTIGNNYSDYANECKFADEDVVGIAMTILDIEPSRAPNLHARTSHAIKGTFKMDASRSYCEYIPLGAQEKVKPFMVHFATREGGWQYYTNLRKLFKKYNVSINKELRDTFVDDFYISLKWKIKSEIKKLLNFGKGYDRK